MRGPVALARFVVGAQARGAALTGPTPVHKRKPMFPATAQNQPLLALLVAVALFVVGLWVRQRRRQLHLRHRHHHALEALRADRSTRRKAHVVPERLPSESQATRVPGASVEGEGPSPQSATPPAQPAQAVAPYVGLERSQAHLFGRLAALFDGKTKLLDEATLEACEDILLSSDVGVSQTGKLLDALKGAAMAANEPLDAQDVRILLRAHLLETLLPIVPGAEPVPLTPAATGDTLTPKVWMFVGVNGVGKTTTIGKLAHHLRTRGATPLLAAGDTYRAAAAEQLAIWAERSGARIVRGQPGADPASVAYNAMEAARTDKADVVLLDTAGRLHTQDDLMQEIQKVRRAVSKQRDQAPDETWLVVDATTGQNALQQAKAFHAALGLTGIVLTKLDGSAKGGIVVAIADALKIPVRFVGLGERAEDLRPFDAHAFVEALV